MSNSRILEHVMGNWIAALFSIFIAVLFLCNDSFSAEADKYRVKFEGIENKDLLEQIRDLSGTHAMSTKPAGSIIILNKRISEDINLFIKLLKSWGYFGAEIHDKVDTSGSPWKVTFSFSLNRQFILTSVNIRFSPEDAGNIEIPEISKTGLILKQAYSSKNVLEGEKKLIALIKKQGFPHPVVEKREITADHESGSVTVEFTLNQGKKAFFGKTVFSGLVDVDHDFLNKLLPWKEGERYDPELLTKCYTNFMNLGLFSIVKITEGAELEGNNLPLEIEVKERKHKSLGVGLNYRSDEGPGIKLSWEHRNLFGSGEKLGFLFNLSDYLTNVEGLFRKPAFLIKEQTLRFSALMSHETPDAYTSDSFSGSVFIDRELTERLDVSGGLTFKSSEITQLGIKESFSLLSMPLHLSLDYSNDLLDPARGGRLAVKLTPYYDPSGDSLYFNKGLINYSHYIKITDNPRIIMAGSITAGMIKGSSKIEIPADERFYAGGGGSVRGYPYQSVGPMEDTTPLGGKALFEVSTEARFKVTDKYGFVLFLDGGSAFTEKFFSNGEKLRWGTGAGLRYFTPIGPLRLDIGFPLNKRDGIDDSFQLYISIGQAF